MTFIRLAAFAALFLHVTALPAAEITTNGTGGGPWSKTDTWRGNVVPGPEDDVVIRKGDTVGFDRNDDGKVTCQKLFLDPRGALTFKAGAGKIVFCVGAGIESYGLIKLDATKAATDSMELRFVGDKHDKRSLKLVKGGALVCRGKAALPEGRHNVALTSPRVDKQTEDSSLNLEAPAGTAVDLQRIDVVNARLQLNEIDNTGAKADEKLNLVENRFTGWTQVFCSKCDTPVVSRNTFEFKADKKWDNSRAINISECPLAEIKGNVIRGPYQFAIACGHGDGVTIADNTIEGAEYGISLGFGRNHGVNQNRVRGCEFGFALDYTQLATLEDNLVDGAKTGLRTMHATAQITTLKVDNLRKDGVGILYAADGNGQASGSLELINCNLLATQVKFDKQPARDAKKAPPITAYHFLVVAVKAAPEETEVEVRTTKPALPSPDAADLNVRNSPAPLLEGATPRPQSAGTMQTFGPLVVRSWLIDFDGKTIAAPEYAVRVLAPADKPGAERKVLKSVTIKPEDSWFSPKPTEAKPTLEVSLK